LGKDAEVIKKLCATGAIAAAAVGATLISTPAHADAHHNWIGVDDSSQSGNVFDNVYSRNSGSGRSINTNNINGITNTASNGSVVVNYRFT
jgi:hypothetical protein